MACEATEHNFVPGGKGEDRWEAWLFCTKCGAIGMVPVAAEQPMTILLPQLSEVMAPGNGNALTARLDEVVEIGVRNTMQNAERVIREQVEEPRERDRMRVYAFCRLQYVCRDRPSEAEKVRS